MQEVCKLRLCCASLWRSGTTGRIFQFFDEQFVAVDDVRHTVSDGLYFKCICLVYYKKKKKKEKKEKKGGGGEGGGPAHLSVFQCEHCVTERRSAR